ncbi:MAG: hypothetical protein M3N18_13145 [Actinomycetota bacterium]|nr:hypothetical protein [Actinomycetota bacterium]
MVSAMRNPRTDSSKRDDATKLKGLLDTRTDWALFGVSVAILVALVPFAAIGHEFAESVAFVGLGATVATVVVDLVARLIGDRKRAGLLFVVVGVAGLILLFALPQKWEFMFIGSDVYSSTEHTPVLFVPGVLGGFVGGAGALLRRPSTREEARERGREWMRQEIKVLAMVGGALAGIFAFFFGIYVLVEYVIAPVLRFFL